MNKNEKIIIKPLQNGYLVEYSYRSMKTAPSEFSSYEYIEEESMFATWDEVVAFVQNTPLEVPPAKI